MFFNQIDNHIPLSSITDGVSQKKRDQPSTNIFLWFPTVRVCDGVQEIIAALNFIPEKQISLTEFKVFNVSILHERNSHGIESCKYPTTARTFLICDWFDLIYLNRKRIIITSLLLLHSISRNRFKSFLVDLIIFAYLVIPYGYKYDQKFLKSFVEDMFPVDRISRPHFVQTSFFVLLKRNFEMTPVYHLLILKIEQKIN